MRFGDLDPATRRAIRNGKAGAPARGRPARARAPRQARSVFAEPTHRCKACGRTFTEWGPAERHVNGAHGGGTVEVLIDRGGSAPQGG